MIRIARNDFTLPHYDIVLLQGATFDKDIDFNKGDEIIVKQQHGTLGTLVDIICGDKKASFWELDVPEWYPVIKSNTKPKI